MFDCREGKGELRTPLLMLYIHEQEPLLCSCETMSSFYDFGNQNAIEMLPKSVPFMCGSTRVILESLWWMIPHQPLHEEYAPWLCGTQESCYDEFYAEMLPKLCRHRHSYDPMPLTDCNTHDIMIMPLEGGWAL